MRKCPRPSRVERPHRRDYISQPGSSGVCSEGRVAGFTHGLDIGKKDQAIDDVMFPFKRSFNAADWQTRTSERRPDPRVLLLGADSQMGCKKTPVIELVFSTLSPVPLIIPFLFIMGSYALVLRAVLKVPSAAGRKKASPAAWGWQSCGERGV